MNETLHPNNESQDSNESAEDLNSLAAKAFHKLLETDSVLLPEWKAAALELTAKGVPQNVSSLKKLLEGEQNADSQKTKS
jgi:hypothetical protein